MKYKKNCKSECKKMLGSLSVILVMGATLFSCQKDTLFNNDKEPEISPMLSNMRADYFDYMGQTYSVDEYPDLFERAGGYFWYYDADGTKHWYFPYSLSPYFRPPYSLGDSIINPITPTPSQPAGKFIHNTIKDIMNASASEISSIVSVNLAETYNPLVSLSAKISSNLLTQVANGTLVISEINETYSESTDQIVYTYLIHFQDVLGNEVETTMVNFVYQIGTFTL